MILVPTALAVFLAWFMGGLLTAVMLLAVLEIGFDVELPREAHAPVLVFWPLFATVAVMLLLILLWRLMAKFGTGARIWLRLAKGIYPRRSQRPRRDD